jgi:hypothetical protein
MNLQYEEAVLLGRALEHFVKDRKYNFDRVSKILSGKKMGVATKDYSDSQKLGMRNRIRAAQQDIDAAEVLQRRFREEITRLSESKLATRPNGAEAGADEE